MTKKFIVKELTRIQRWKEIFLFAWHTRPSLWVFAAALVVAAGYFLCSSDTSPWQEFLAKFSDSPLDSALQGVVLLAATSIWIFQVAQDWKNELPKFISVDFVHSGKIRIRCCYASLLGESDARGMAQSLGQAINKGARLPIAPTLDGIKIVEMKDASEQINSGNPFLHYSVIVRMTEDIQRLGVPPKKEKLEDEGSSQISEKDCDESEGMPECIPADKYLCWTWPFEPPTNDDLEPYSGK